jgi:hypothetical protein
MQLTSEAGVAARDGLSRPPPAALIAFPGLGDSSGSSFLHS